MGLTIDRRINSCLEFKGYRVRRVLRRSCAPGSVARSGSSSVPDSGSARSAAASSRSPPSDMASFRARHLDMTVASHLYPLDLRSLGVSLLTPSDNNLRTLELGI